LLVMGGGSSCGDGLIVRLISCGRNKPQRFSAGAHWLGCLDQEQDDQSDCGGDDQAVYHSSGVGRSRYPSSHYRGLLFKLCFRWVNHEQTLVYGSAVLVCHGLPPATRSNVLCVHLRLGRFA
jgi:hypothetical protein